MTQTSDIDGEAFFHRRETREQIRRLSRARRLCIYAGAGVTINRSSLDWAGMVNAILSPNVADASLRQNVIRSFGPLRAASAAAQLFIDSAEGELGSDFARDRLVDTLRYRIYSQGSWLDGRLARNIALLAYGLLHSWPESSVCIVTPNYDDYLHEILGRVRDELARSDKDAPEPVVRYPTDSDPLKSNAGPQADSWMDDASESLFRPGALSIVHLHGRIRSSSEGEQQRYPVISEGDYALTTGWTEKALERILAVENVETMFIGTSIMDTPLVNALERTRERKGHRCALVCTQNDRDLKTREYRMLANKRFDHLGIKPIYHDYYIQAAQFLQEMVTCLESEDPDEYVRHSSTVRYGSRLVRWWNDWNHRNDGDIEAHQRQCHQLLRAGADLVRHHLEAPGSESLKIEVWLRWNPASHRTLRLWASSSGTWPEVDSMREGSITTDDEYLSVRAFRDGRPLLLDGATVPAGSPPVTHRWRSFLSMPLWHDEDQHGAVPVGVITLASSRQGTEGSLTSNGSQIRLSACMQHLQYLGAGITSPRGDALRGAQRMIDKNLRALRSS
jgi:SIR2-like domain